MSEKTLRVYPSSKLGDTEYVKGVGADGADLPEKEAEALLEAGLVQKSKPKPAEPAEKPEE